MWEATAWAAITWLKITALLAALVGGCWLLLGTTSPWFALAVITATLLELHLTTALIREWGLEAGMHWWWTR